MVKVIAAIIISYFLGSIPFAIIVTRIVKGVDVRQFGSRNAGATNVYRVAGLPAALFVGLLDLAKGFAAVFWIAAALNSPDQLSLLQLQIICAVAVMLGHMFTLFAGFKGGKGVLAAAGALLAIMPAEVGIAFAVFLIFAVSTRYISLGSITAALALFIVTYIEHFLLDRTKPTELLILVAVIALIVVLAHKSNIGRLLSGTENKVGRKKDGS